MKKDPNNVLLKQTALSLNASEQKKVDVFVEHHERLYRASIEKVPIFTLKFSPTGVGTKIEIACSCGDNLDVSDYEGW